MCSRLLLLLLPRWLVERAFDAICLARNVVRKRKDETRPVIDSHVSFGLIFLAKTQRLP